MQSALARRGHVLTQRRAQSRMLYPCDCSPESLAAERSATIALGLPYAYSGRCRDAPHGSKTSGPHVLRLRLDQVRAPPLGFRLSYLCHT